VSSPDGAAPAGAAPPGTTYDRLRQGIIDGSYRPGEWLREEVLAQALDVSRTPIRESLRRLQSDGLVRLERNRGAQVVEMSREDIDTTYEIRAVLEGMAARRVARLGHPDLAGLEDLCSRMEALLDVPRMADVDYSQVTSLNLQFHRSLHEASGSAVLGTVLSGIVQVSLVRNTFQKYSREQLEGSFRQHRELVEAIRVGDQEWADVVMRSHILTARATLERIAAAGDGPDRP
jgi:DNA-binding GntR family transcriptional regulator